MIRDTLGHAPYNAYWIAPQETSRPTAVNLRNACNDIKKLMAEVTTEEEILSGIVYFAERLMKEDLANCRKMGEHCAEAIENQTCGAYLATGGDDPECHLIRDRYRPPP